MAAKKFVNASFIVTREGIAKSYPMPKLPYARYVTVQVALAGALVQLIGFGTRRAAEEVEEVPPEDRILRLRGTQDLSFSLQADHGNGSSSFGAAYSGVSKESADNAEALVMMVYNAALGT